MESFLLLLVGIRDFLSDFFHYFLEEVLTDRRRLVKLILGILAAILVFLGIRAVLSHAKKNADQAALEPESQMVIPIEMTISTTPVPEVTVTPTGAAEQGASETVSGAAVATETVGSGALTMVNGYSQKKSGGSTSFTTNTRDSITQVSTPDPALEAETTTESDIMQETREGE